MRMDRFLALVSGLALLAATGCSAPPLATPTPVAGKAQIANPASENCIAAGGKLTIERSSGGETGICTFPDGSSCEEWAFLRGECRSGHTVQATGTPEPTRIVFARGGTDYYVDGQLRAGEVRPYVLYASQGQLMMVNVDSPRKDVRLTIYGLKDGQPLVRAASDATFWHGELPGTQDYVVELVGPQQPTGYALTVTIPSRVAFAPGSSDTTLKGDTQLLTTYMLSASAGQKLSVTAKPASGVSLSIMGLDDGLPLLTGGDRAREWSGTLATTQHYAITVLPSSGPCAYELTISLK